MWLLRFAYPAAILSVAFLAPTSAWADVFDDARKTFEHDIPHFFQTDVPHFFQDDIPCAFGGKPTSHTKASCNSPSHPATKSGNAPPSAGTGSQEGEGAPPSPDR
jgi:hypothetical protein